MKRKDQALDPNSATGEYEVKKLLCYTQKTLRMMNRNYYKMFIEIIIDYYVLVQMIT